MKKGTATVIKNTGKDYLLSELPEWNPFPAVIRGRMRLKGLHTTNPVAVGDIVEYEAEEDSSAVAAIIKVLPRKNYIIRKSVNLSRECHIIAANLDRACLVVTLDFPETKWPFIDRFLVTCEAYKVPVTIILNKTDLYGPEFNDLKEYFLKVYGGAGYDIMETSVWKNEGIDRVRNFLCDGGLTLLSGVSGVGKSSLLKAIDPTLEPKISEISLSTLQGRHTTTFYEIYPIKGGGYLIDTPGIRGFGLIDMKAEEVSLYFPEMLRVMDECRYKPCTHTHEPHCAVKEAVDSGVISPERYNSYLGMLEEETKYRQAER